MRVMLQTECLSLGNFEFLIYTHSFIKESVNVEIYFLIIVNESLTIQHMRGIYMFRIDLLKKLT